MWMCESCTWINRDASNQCEKCGVAPKTATTRVAAPKQNSVSTANPLLEPESDEIVQPKFHRNDPLRKVQKQVLKQVHLHEEEFEHADEAEEHIAWDSAGHLGEAVRGIARKRRAEGAASIIPPGASTEIPPLPIADSTSNNSLAITLSIAVAGLLLVIAIIAFKVSDTLSNNDTSAYSPYDTTQVSGGLFSHTLVPSALDGLWLGTDHRSAGAGGAGTPVKYVFSSPDWLMVIGANTADTDTTMSESSYRFDGKVLTTASISSSAGPNGDTPVLPPTSASALLEHESLTLFDGSTSLSLERPEQVAGKWMSPPIAGVVSTTFAFTNPHRIIWANLSEPGVNASGSGSYTIAGNVLNVIGPTPAAIMPSWTFTFDAGDLVLYPRGASTDSTDTSVRLMRQ